MAAVDEGFAAEPRRRFRPAAAFVEALAAEGERRVLWLPVFFGAGIAAYFALTVEPPLWLGIAAALVTAVLAVAVRHWLVWRGIAVALAFAAAGLAIIQLSRWEHAAPVLERRLGSVAVTGRIIDIDQVERGWRAVIAPDPLPGLAAEAQPRKIRIRIPANSDALRPGDRVSMRARLYPPPAQIVPGGWDLQRTLYFAGIGAVGYSFGPARRVEPAGMEPGGGWREWLLRLRADMTARITTALPGSTGGVAAALITGKRGAISEEVTQAFRDSGLAHLLAISGMNLALAGGFVFLVVRGGLALLPWVALRYPINRGRCL